MGRAGRSAVCMKQHKSAILISGLNVQIRSLIRSQREALTCSNPDKHGPVRIRESSCHVFAGGLCNIHLGALKRLGEHPYVKANRQRLAHGFHKRTLAFGFINQLEGATHNCDSWDCRRGCLAKGELHSAGRGGRCQHSRNPMSLLD